MYSQLPIWVQYFAALSPATLAFAALVVSAAIQIRQWKTAKEKLKLDLLDKRTVVYHFLIEAHSDHIMNGQVSDESWGNLYRGANSAKFLFEPKISGLISDFAEELFDLKHLDRQSSREVLKEEIRDAIFQEIDQKAKRLETLRKEIDSLIVSAIRIDVPK